MDKIKDKCKSIFSKIVTVIVVLFLLYSLKLVLFGFRGILVPKVVEKEKVVVLNSSMVKDKFEMISELASTKYYYTQVESYDKDNKINGWSIPFTSKRLVIKYDGVILAGIDTNDLKINIDDNNKIINITVPEAKIMSNTVDEESAEVLIENDTIFNPIKAEDFKQMRKEQQKSAELTAKERGILKEARENAKIAIKDILNMDKDIANNYQINILER